MLLRHTDFETTIVLTSGDWCGTRGRTTAAVKWWHNCKSVRKGGGHGSLGSTTINPGHAPAQLTAQAGNRRSTTIALSLFPSSSWWRAAGTEPESCSRVSSVPRGWTWPGLASRRRCRSGSLCADARPPCDDVCTAQRHRDLLFLCFLNISLLFIAVHCVIHHLMECRFYYFFLQAC